MDSWPVEKPVEGPEQQTPVDLQPKTNTLLGDGELLGSKQKQLQSVSLSA